MPRNSFLAVGQHFRLSTEEIIVALNRAKVVGPSEYTEVSTGFQEYFGTQVGGRLFRASLKISL